MKLMASTENTERKTRGPLVGATGAGVFAAGGCSAPQPLTQGKDPGLKQVYWGEGMD